MVSDGFRLGRPYLFDALPERPRHGLAKPKTLIDAVDSIGHGRVADPLLPGKLAYRDTYLQEFYLDL